MPYASIRDAQMITSRLLFPWATVQLYFADTALPWILFELEVVAPIFLLSKQIVIASV